MTGSIFENLGLDPAIVVLILAALVIILLIVVLIMIVKMEKLYRRYDIFMRGKDAETLEDKIAEIYTKVHRLHDQDLANRDVMKVLSRGMVNSFQKTGIVKYNAFEGMGGQSSFALALLDQNNSGILFNAMHSRTSCYIYVKEIREGQPETSLGREEKQALEMAMEKRIRALESED